VPIDRSAAAKKAWATRQAKMGGGSSGSSGGSSPKQHDFSPEAHQRLIQQKQSAAASAAARKERKGQEMARQMRETALESNRMFRGYVAAHPASKGRVEVDEVFRSMNRSRSGKSYPTTAFARKKIASAIKQSRPKVMAERAMRRKQGFPASSVRQLGRSSVIGDVVKRMEAFAKKRRKRQPNWVASGGDETQHSIAAGTAKKKKRVRY